MPVDDGYTIPALLVALTILLLHLFPVCVLLQGDVKGNLVFRNTARNFNPDCARAGEVSGC